MSRYAVCAESLACKEAEILYRTNDLEKAMSVAAKITSQIISPATFNNVYIIDHSTHHYMVFLANGVKVVEPSFPY